jgi:hypothetical protein
MASISVEIDIDVFSTTELMDEVIDRWEVARKRDLQTIRDAFEKMDFDFDEEKEPQPDSMMDVLKTELGQKLAHHLTIDQLEQCLRTHAPNAV